MGGTDRLLVAPNERVDLEDFDHAVNEGLNAATQQTPGNFLTTPEGDRAWILEGFEVDNSDGFPNPPDLGGIQVRVTRGRAILSRIESGVVSYGIVSTLGDPEKIINISSFSNGTFGVYIRFQFVDGDLESRAFWDSSGATGFSQSVATRRKANWSMRIESTNPGAEWLKVADMTVAAGVVSALVDLRPFYFEGRIDKGYDSGWSTDSDPTGADDLLPVVPIVAAGLPTWPGGTGIAAIVTITDTSEITAEDFVRLDSDGRWYKVFSVVPSTSFVVEDVHGHGGTFPSGAGQSSLQIHRGTARSEDGVPDLQTFTAAMRQCLEDLKGRGLRRWWARDIGGMNIGFDADPAEDTLQIGDDDFKISNITPSPASFPGFQFDTGGDIFFYDRAANTYRAQIAGASEWTLDAAGVTITNGLSVGHLTTPVDNVVSIGAATFNLDWNSAAPKINFTVNDSIGLPSASQLDFTIDGNNSLELVPLGARIPASHGLVVGFAGIPSADEIQLGDANFKLDFDGTDPSVVFDSGDDRIFYDRSANALQTEIGGAQASDLRLSQAAIHQILSLKASSLIVVGPTAFTSFSGVFPFTVNGVMQVGSTLRIKAMIAADGNGSTSESLRLDLDGGGALVTIATNATPDSATEYYVDLLLRVSSAGATGVIIVTGMTTIINSGGSIQFPVNIATAATLGLDVPWPIDFQASITGGTAADTLTMTSLAIDWGVRS